MTWKRFDHLQQADRSYALYELGSRWLNNVIVTKLHLQHCIDNSWGYRVSSSLFPCLTHPEFSSDNKERWRTHIDVVLAECPQHDLIKYELYLCSKLILSHEPRISTHPDHFNVLASEDQLAVSKSIKELNVHGWLLDQLGCPRDHNAPINIHVNNTKGCLSDIASRFRHNLERCDHSVTSRLVIENEDKGCWTVANLLKHFDTPITYDNLHDKCNPSQLPCRVLESILKEPTWTRSAWGMSSCAATWGSIKPLFHYSESHPDKPNPRSHADMPSGCPPSDSYDWDIELKSKDVAVRSCYDILSNIGEVHGLGN